MSTKYKIILMYDIPTNTKEEKKYFQKFNKSIKKIGFMMLQQSVYVRSINSKEEYQTIKNKLEIIESDNTNIRLLLLTQNKYETIEILSGKETICY